MTYFHARYTLLLIVTVYCHLPLDPSTSIRPLFHQPNPLSLPGESLIDPLLPRLPLPLLPKVPPVPICQPGVPLDQQDRVQALADEVQVLAQTLLPQLLHDPVLVEVVISCIVGGEIV